MDKSSLQSNLDCFLISTTPFVPSQFLAKSEIRNLNRLWHPWEREKVEYFKLADLWNCYDEWSAYGAGIPIRLDTGETLVQYYVPYLSAIQIFTSTSPANFLREEAESVCETRDSFSDSLSDESESEKLSRWDGCSSEEGAVEQDSLSRTNDRLGYLYFQYFERCTPYGRVPLMDKINGFAERYPGLMSLRSVDLSPASWMAVAWYPIYHIPMGRTIKDLSTCFLTFHTLSSSFQEYSYSISFIFVQIWTLKMTWRMLIGKERKEKRSLSHLSVWPLTRCRATCGYLIGVDGTKRGWCHFLAWLIRG
ncbi:uncharacterized protein LOC107787477 isoform X2 [Nicotiana tabacum]|uniref:Uncharacterized protein LOC107787477 isoform X2 n=2 Tax=Nicotiana TaxID=4085 RepID=A0AC58USX9_TOBAC|nr:PREDICTED: uncharacterized protein LOC104219069 isoform X2 [Nicotiana sylvestris]